MSYCGVLLIKYWHKLIRETENTIKVISKTQKISSTDFTSYKANQKSNIKQKKIDIKQFLNGQHIYTYIYALHIFVFIISICKICLTYPTAERS